MFSVRLRGGGKPDIQPIDRALLVMRMGRRLGYLWIMTESAVAEFAEDVVASLNACTSRLSSHRAWLAARSRAVEE